MVSVPSVPSTVSSPVSIGGSDLSTRSIDSNFATRVVTICRRGKIKLSYLLSQAASEVCTVHQSTRPFPFPYEIVEMIIAHLARDLHSLKACSLTCRSWYTAVAPLLHHTLTLTEERPRTSRSPVELLSKLHELGLTPLVKEIQMSGSRLYPYHFPTFANLHTLKIREININSFTPGTEQFFKHLSPTLRSIALFEPSCTARQLSHFLSFFANMDNVEIRNPYMCITPADTTDLETDLVPFSTPKLRGRLELHNFNWVEPWVHLITSCDGLRFRHMDLHRSTRCAPILLKACGETLETLRFDTTDGKFCIGLFTDLD